jgi:hypothetical protein
MSFFINYARSSRTFAFLLTGLFNIATGEEWSKSTWNRHRRLSTVKVSNTFTTIHLLFF